MQELKVSIVIPTFNRGHTLTRAIDSVLSQSYSNFELIVVDDGSTDDTQNILKKISNISILKQENKGVSAARNSGIKKASGEWIAFLDSDDEWLPTKLEKQVAVILENTDAVCVYTNEIWIRNGVRVNLMKKHKKSGGDLLIPSLTQCLIAPSSVMLKKATLIKLGCFREDYPVCEDYDLWLKLTSLYSVIYIDEPLIRKYGGHDDQLSKAVAMDYFRVRSLDWLIKNRGLGEIAHNTALKVLKIKSKNLIKGYLKHDNLANLSEIRSIISSY